MSELIEIARYSRRGSVRRFDSTRPVEDSTLDALLAASAHAPNTGNMQLYSVVVTREPELKARLAQLHFGQPAATGAPVLLTFCADVRRFAHWCKVRKAQSGLDNLGGKFTAATDAAIFAQQFVTLAELNGLGTCFLGTATYNLEGFCEALGLPEGVIPVLGLAVGYPAAEAVPSDRLPLDVIRHRERFLDYTDEAIEAAYSEKENLPESAGFIAENGKETLAQVYAEVRYPKTLNEGLSEALAKAFE